MMVVMCFACSLVLITMLSNNVDGLTGTDSRFLTLLLLVLFKLCEKLFELRFCVFDDLLVLLLRFLPELRAR